MTQLLAPVSSVSHTVRTCTQVVQWDRCTPLYTGIADLCKVKKFLKSVNDWQSLGLELGLLYSTLKRIRREQREDINDCMMEMLAEWLQQQDNVCQVGVPSWSVLQAALKNIGENDLADTITTQW